MKRGAWDSLVSGDLLQKRPSTYESFNDWGGRGYDDFVPKMVTKTATSKEKTARSSIWSASLP